MHKKAGQDMDETSKEIDIDEIAEKYEEQSFFKRLKTMFSGLKCSKYSREYKLARIELQRLAAPLVAVVVPTLVVVVLCVVTMVSTQLCKDTTSRHSSARGRQGGHCGDARRAYPTR